MMMTATTTIATTTVAVVMQRKMNITATQEAVVVCESFVTDKMAMAVMVVVAIVLVLMMNGTVVFRPKQMMGEWISCCR